MKRKLETFYTFFANIVSNLKIPPHQYIDFAGGVDPKVGDDPITFISEKYKIHAIIIAIKNFGVKISLSILKL